MKTIALFEYECDIFSTKRLWRHMLDRDGDGYVVSWWSKWLASYVMMCEFSVTDLEQAVRIFLDHYRSNSPQTNPTNNIITIVIKDDTILETVKRLAPVVLGERACNTLE